MAFKVKGTYAPEKREHTGKDGKPITHAVVGIDEVAEALISSVHRKADPTTLPTLDDSDLGGPGE
jgi:hypothetical protein